MIILDVAADPVVAALMPQSNLVRVASVVVPVCCLIVAALSIPAVRSAAAERVQGLAGIREFFYGPDEHADDDGAGGAAAGAAQADDPWEGWEAALFEDDE